MSRSKWPSRVLGIAFLLQFVTSIVSGVIVKPTLVVPGDIVATMTRIAARPGLMTTYMLLDMFTALGVVLLGVMLFLNLRKQNEGVALVGMAFYILEGGVLAASKLQSFSLLRYSQVYVSGDQAPILTTMAEVALESMEFVGFDLHMIAFCIGAILFYTLLVTSRAVPRALSLWGLISVSPLLVATLLGIYGVAVPFALAIPYVPFEFVIGVWILVKGVGVPESPRAAALRGRLG